MNYAWKLFDLVSVTLVAKMSAPKHKIPSNLWTSLIQTLICHESYSSKNNLVIQHTESPPHLSIQRSFAFDPDIENQMDCPDLYEDSLMLPCTPENHSEIEMTVNDKPSISQDSFECSHKAVDLSNWCRSIVVVFNTKRT